MKLRKCVICQKKFEGLDKIGKWGKRINSRFRTATCSPKCSSIFRNVYHYAKELVKNNNSNVGIKGKGVSSRA